MKNENLKSIDLFLIYKKLSSLELDNYNYLRGKFPYQQFPRSAACLWRMSVLAEMYRCLHLSLKGLSSEKD